MTVIPQTYPLFVVYLGANGNDCRVFPSVFAVVAWHHYHEGGVGEPVTIGLAGAENPGEAAFTRRFFHSHEAAAAYIAQEQATPPHAAGH
ncbi:hypothetical protein [Actinoplanes rectilineatus]|uniref:hypothetical protein n=1 Tax=Actinoplanes rectilineatus TaxID=113571 RepID=UPI0005F2C8C0|nr:hypothetical protein [Actinoplanes rectilineatus]